MRLACLLWLALAFPGGAAAAAEDEAEPAAKSSFKIDFAQTRKDSGDYVLVLTARGISSIPPAWVSRQIQKTSDAFAEKACPIGFDYMGEPAVTRKTRDELAKSYTFRCKPS